MSDDESFSDRKIIKKTLKELAIYLVFLVTACIVALGNVGSSLFYATDMLNNLLVRKTFQSNVDTDLSYNDVTAVSEFWQFTEKVLLNGLYGDEDMFHDNSTKIFGENQLLGPVRFRQLRVRNNSCTIHELFSDLFKTCFSYYSEENAEKARFGLEEGTAWNYHAAEELDGFFSWGQIQFYPGGGYLQDLVAKQKEPNRLILESLKNNHWIDRATRAVFIEFTVYNANVNMFCVTKLIAEITPTGGIIVSSKFSVMSLLKFVSTFDYVMFGFEILFIIQLLWYTFEEIKDFCRTKQKYLAKFWNWVDFLIILIAYFAFGVSIFRFIHINEKITDFNKNPKKYVNFEKLSFLHLQFVDFTAICVFLIWIKILKYISFNKTMGQFASTLGRCTKELLGFAIMFFIVFVAYAQLGYILFGTENKDFRSFLDSIFTLMRTILGDFDYLAIERTNRTLGPVYFLSYIFFVFFVLLNMFLAIINETYSNVKSEIRKDNMHIGQYVKNKFMQFGQRMCFCKNKTTCMWNVAQKDEVLDENLDLKKQSFYNLPGQSTNGNTIMNQKCLNCKINFDKFERLQNRISNLEIAVDNITFKYNEFLNKIHDMHKNE